MPIELRIHGDNIIECERALSLITDSFSATAHRSDASPVYLPRYAIKQNQRTLFLIELFSGHGRWNFDVAQVLQSYGAPLREATDAVVTRILPDGHSEEIVVAFEFCSALPAGNNAWQRNGRALACAAVGVPYIFFAEVGGVELGAKRRIKAPRFPNPIVPFSYLTTDQAFQVVCLPVYAASPSSAESIRLRFAPAFGIEDGRRLVKSFLENAHITEPHSRLMQKALTLVEILAEQRQSLNTLRGEQWNNFLKNVTANQKVNWLSQNRMAWARKQTGKVATTKTFRALAQLFQVSECISIGAKDIPICLVLGEKRKTLATRLHELYGNALPRDFFDWVDKSNLPLVVVWITGFKPRGDDSRPDRGLVPLARMLFGKDAEILSIVSGPAKPAMWQTWRNAPKRLAQQNGLWEAIINLSDAVLTDSTTDQQGAFARVLERTHAQSSKPIQFASASATNVFSEHDVDCALHLLFAHQRARGIVESICNPPGGDWSGLSVLDFESGAEYRWTSLPRVSGTAGKRPDHVIQFATKEKRMVLLAIESKNRAMDLERGVGIRLKRYTRQLVKSPPTIARAANAEWQLLKTRAHPVGDLAVISGGAFCWNDQAEFEMAFKRNQLDIAFAFEFKSPEQASLLHIRANASAQFLLPVIQNLVGDFGGRLEIQIH
jgi:hypothetical protein